MKDIKTAHSKEKARKDVIDREFMKKPPPLPPSEPHHLL
jgi:hypothetical protein